MFTDALHEINILRFVPNPSLPSLKTGALAEEPSLEGRIGVAQNSGT